MKDINELEQALIGAAAEYSYETKDNDFACLANIKVEDGWADVSIIKDFTLTAEELNDLVPVFKRLLDAKLYDFVSFLPDELPIEIIDNLLTRIEQWQDGNK